MEDIITILNPSKCDYFKDGDCIYEEKCEEQAPKCEDIQKIGRCHALPKITEYQAELLKSINGSDERGTFVMHVPQSFGKHYDRRV